MVESGTGSDRVIKEVYGMLAFIAQGFEYKSQGVMLQLYSTLVRPHLMYSSACPITGRIWRLW